MPREFAIRARVRAADGEQLRSALWALYGDACDMHELIEAILPNGQRVTVDPNRSFTHNLKEARNALIHNH